jgi:hypothetical protein
MCNCHYRTDTSTRSGVAVIMQRPWPLVKGNGFILVSDFWIFTGCWPGIIILAPSSK